MNNDFFPIKFFFILFTAIFTISACTTTTIPTNRSIKKVNSLSIADKNYTGLQQIMPIYQEAVLHPWPTLTSNHTLRPGGKGKTVLALRARLRATGELKPEEDSGLKIYDDQLTEAVKLFQSSHGLEQTGAVGPATLAELNVSPVDRLRQIEVNMQRWQKLSHELSNRFILVNIPDYRLEVIENGKTVLSMKAVVGKPARPTPEISSVVTRLVLNPYWNVPKSIAQQDIIPKVINNPNYLNEMHIEVLEQQVDDPITIDPEEVDWQSMEENGFIYHFRQEPGEDNALGLVKFEFDNSKDIYLHDTPAKNLFDVSKRDFSSGCIRLEKPFELANYLMKNDPAWDETYLQNKLDEGKTSYIKASMPTEIIITYLTAWVDGMNNIQFRDDIYMQDNMTESPSS